MPTKLLSSDIYIYGFQHPCPAEGYYKLTDIVVVYRQEMETRPTIAGQSIPTFPLHSTSEKAIPLLGFGTAEFPFGAPIDTLKQTILEAIKLGDAHHDCVLPALKQTLENLKLEYLDLYLIHWPVRLKPGKWEFPFKEEDLGPIDLKSEWEAMEECQALGLTKSLGVSNLSCKKLQTILSTAKIPPAVEMNSLWQQKKLRKFCEEKGILIEAYSPLGTKGTARGTNRVIECEVPKEIAQAKGKSLAQCKVYAAGDFVSDDGPHKTVEEFWDGEI
ncbi:hypothetical protein CXB51_001480 [Gossypium anomalum]|uniref:NADP-dependent oxidoreductase domain-containing protein n=1 Tax=Gossypium anomalum TaxID=47600 RepID=A0A8J5ZL42_9ROSI|nr:hypothetical protein CXB51_001480 [Gossypium anomalum]